jgi:hypothetical protein
MKPIPSSKRPLAVLAAFAVVSAGVLATRSLLERSHTVNELRTLRDQVYRARVSVDSCRNELAYQERLFRRFDTVVDSLRGEVRAFESLDERGVPEDRYEEYLELFEGYNDSVAVWRGRAAALRETEAACRTFIDEHNILADSLRNRLGSEGVTAGGSRRPGRPDGWDPRTGAGAPRGTPSSGSTNRVGRANPRARASRGPRAG